MGSITRFSRLERFVEKFHERFETRFQSLVGLTVESISDVEVNYHVKADILLSNDKFYVSHFRWATEEESYEEKELLEEDDLSMEEYYKEYVIGKTIQRVELAVTDRDDEVYLLAFVDDGICLEIPMGFDPEGGDFYSYADEMLSDEEKESLF